MLNKLTKNISKEEALNNNQFWNFISVKDQIPGIQEHAEQLGNVLGNVISSKMNLEEPKEHHDAYSSGKKIAEERVKVAKSLKEHKLTVSKKKLVLETIMVPC